MQVPERTRDMTVVDANLVPIRELLDRFSALADPVPFLVGKDITLADCAYPSTLMYLDLVTPALGRTTSYPGNIAAWRDTVLAHPAVSTVMATNRAAGEACPRNSSNKLAKHAKVEGAPNEHCRLKSN